MQGKRSLVWILAIVAAGYTLSVDAGASYEEATKWNEKAASHVLAKGTLVELDDAFPDWKRKQITWPSVTEVSSASVTVGEKLKTSCIGWLQRFMKKEQLPGELKEHLVAMNDWGLFRKASEQKRLCDVFLARFAKGPYVVHIQESPYNVIIAISDERLATKGKADHKDLVLRMAEMVLHQHLVPEPAKDLLQLRPKRTRQGALISTLEWAPPSAVGKDKKGHKSISTRVTGRIGTFHIRANTDGRFVCFNILKATGGSRLIRDPYVQRFSASKSE